MQIPILMYHKVGAPVSSKADRFLNVSARSFERQMRLLARLGYRGVTFAEAVSVLAESEPARRRVVCITFDDGHQNVYEHAFPVLQAMRWPATVFVPTAYVGRANEWDRATGKPILPIMDWPLLLELQGAGWEMSGHTRTHPHLEALDDEAALREMAEGKADLESRLGKPVRTFCYPFGGLNERTPALARQVGFIAACTTRSGLARPDLDLFLLPRVKIAYRDGVWGLLYRLLLRPRLGWVRSRADL